MCALQVKNIPVGLRMGIRAISLFGVAFALGVGIQYLINPSALSFLNVNTAPILMLSICIGLIGLFFIDSLIKMFQKLEAFKQRGMNKLEIIGQVGLYVVLPVAGMTVLALLLQEYVAQSAAFNKIINTLVAVQNSSANLPMLFGNLSLAKATMSISELQAQIANIQIGIDQIIDRSKSIANIEHTEKIQELQKMLFNAKNKLDSIASNAPSVDIVMTIGAIVMGAILIYGICQFLNALGKIKAEHKASNQEIGIHKAFILLFDPKPINSYASLENSGNKPVEV